MEFNKDKMDIDVLDTSAPENYSSFISINGRIACNFLNDYMIATAKDSQPPKNTNKNNKKNNKKNDKKNSDKSKNIDNEELINMILGNELNEESADEESEDSDTCDNPLCNCLDYDSESDEGYESEDPPKNIKNIDDLIKLGKSYRCKRRQACHGISLRILSNLVPPLTELKNLVGMKTVKENIVNQIVFFLQGFDKKNKCGECIDCIYELPCTQNLNNDMLHTVITGPPGVGKTELGKILGHVYKAMGVLSQGHMHIATRSDLVGKYLGHTAAKTQAFINKCKGGVMFIDEAYALGNPEGRDSFSKECIDTINQNLTETRDMLCIIAGYKGALEKCFFAYNEGLRRRFTFRYDIPGYSVRELMEIFLLKVRKDGWYTEWTVAPNEEKRTEELLKFFTRHKESFPHFGGDMETLFLNCKIHHGKRVLFSDPSIRRVLTQYDIKAGFDTFVDNRKYAPKSDAYSHMYI